MVRSLGVHICEISIDNQWIGVEHSRWDEALFDSIDQVLKRAVRRAILVSRIHPETKNVVASVVSSSELHLHHTVIVKSPIVLSNAGARTIRYFASVEPWRAVDVQHVPILAIEHDANAPELDARPSRPPLVGIQIHKRLVLSMDVRLPCLR